MNCVFVVTRMGQILTAFSTHAEADRYVQDRILFLVERSCDLEYIEILELIKQDRELYDIHPCALDIH